MANEIFRLLSLRRSRKSTGDSTSPDADPRLRYRPLLEAQATPAPSTRDRTLVDLKKRYQQTVDKIAQFEAVQSAVTNAYFSAELKTSSTLVKEANRATRTATLPASGADVPPAVAVGGDSFLRSVEHRLGEKHAALFRSVIDGVPRDTLRDIAVVSGLFEVGGLTDEANRLCAEIHAVEDNVGDGLPTVSGEDALVTKPIVASLGWGDLVIARESLVGYDAREIAHIENILPGESKLRELSRIAKSEQTNETETTTEKETEKDSQTTDRYELQAQSQETIARNFSVSTGVNTSAKYGLTQVDMSLDAAFSQSQTQSRSSSIDTAREVISKAVERTFERVRVLRRLVLTEEIHELNRHELTNVGGSTPPKPVSGI